LGHFYLQDFISNEVVAGSVDFELFDNCPLIFSMSIDLYRNYFLFPIPVLKSD